MQDFSGGGANFNFCDFGYTCREAACCEQRSCEPLLGGFGGMPPHKKILKNGANSCVLRAIFNHFHGKKSSQKIINKHEFFHGPFYNAALPIIYLNIDVMDT